MVDTVIIKQPEAPQEDQEHIDKMVALVDKANEAPASEAPEASGERPGWLPEKFKSAEDLAKAYAELEGKLGAPNKTEETAPVVEKTTEETSQTDEDASKALAEKGLDLGEFNTEWAEKGGLSDESYSKLEKAGIPKATVDQYIAGQQALANQYQTDVKSAAGGDAGFSEMAEWAKVNASKEDLAAYNKAVDSGDKDQAKLAVAGLFQKFQESGRGGEPTLVRADGVKTTGDVYESIAQMQKDMASADYKTDPAFRRKVEAKLSRSNIL